MDTRKITQYKLVRGGEENEFEEKIMNMLKDGWVLYRSPFYTGPIADNTLQSCSEYVQAMVKYEN